MSVSNITEFTVDPGSRGEFLDLIRSSAQQTRDTEGCISFRFFTDRENPGRVIFIEEWETEELQAAYATKQMTDGSIQQLMSHLKALPHTAMLDEIS